MSTARLNVWASVIGRPCEIESKKTLYVYVLHCDGRVLEWCGRKYVALPTKCGHLEVEIPPGCYIVGAVENPNGIPPLGNHLTHIQIVRANCGDHVCVTLFNPTLHFCGHWFKTAMTGHAAAGGQGVPRELTAAMRNAIDAVEKVEALLPQDPMVAQMKGVEAIPRPKGGTATESVKGGSKKGNK